LQPDVVIDIGIAEGTPWLYSAFPDAEYLLFEPLRESAPHLARLERQLNAKNYPVALGDRDGEMLISVRPEIAASSLYDEVTPEEIAARYPVPVRRFDGLVAADALERTVFCKIDVQGAELTVLRGMGERLTQMDALLIEVSTIATLHDGPEFRDVHAFLDAAGFLLYDILYLAHRPLDCALAQIDALYVPANSPLRTSHRWR
jgi:FkbM family methyltransferase